MSSKQPNNKEIVVLDEHEHVLQRPTMYVGAVELTEEKIPIVRDGRIVIEQHDISVGFYKLFHEILDNAVDEAKRLKGKMKSIKVTIDSTNNLVEIIDGGEGFHNGTAINKKSGLTNIETAISQLRAGSNFNNDNINDALIGTNGVGAALVNMLSSKFYIETRNKESYFHKEWNNFKSNNTTMSKGIQVTTGTKVGFIPRKDVFKKARWNKDIIRTQMIFKNFLLKQDEVLASLKFEVFFDGEKLALDVPFYPPSAFVYKSKLGHLILYESYDSSGSLSFVNSAMCTGIHQRIINENINKELDDTLGHHFYETFFVLNLPPKLVRFQDQNKTRLASTRDDVEGTILENFRRGLQQFYTTDLFQKILKRVEDRKMSTEVNKLRNVKKKTNMKKSSKYFPPSGRIENLFIVEGESAMGSILQKRDTKTDGVYSLKGKINNVRSVSDLSGNEEIVALMQILDLDLDPNKRNFTYKRIIIASDADEDGGHICSLLVNLFYRWFPYIIDEGKLYRLKIPLMSIDEGKSRQYFFDKKEFEEFQRKKKSYKGLRFLKGLGSLAEEDWEHIMANKQLLQIQRGEDAKKFLDMAFGMDSAPRKKWLSNEFE